MSEIRVWRADPSEAEVTARLLVAFREHLGSGRPSDNAILAGVERLMEGLDAEFLLASPDPDSAPSGVCQLRFRFSLWEAAPDCWLEDLFVAGEARRRGLGSALLDAACTRAAQRGCRRIELDTSEENAPALALYAAHGFSPSSKGPGRDLFLGRRITPAER